MNQTINISATATLATIDIEGTIGSQPQGDSVTTYQALREKLNQISTLQSPLVVVNIRSVGGDVSDALLIYEALRSLDAHITTRCYGYTASAATIIAQAANEGCREIADSALYLIHNSSCATEGNASELLQQAELLKKTDERIAAIYATHSDKESDHFIELMAQNGGNGIWLSPEQTIEAGLADTIIKPETASSTTLIDRIAQWLGVVKKSESLQQLPTDQGNIRPLSSHCTTISLSEGQKAVKQSKTKAIEDPGIQHTTPSANSVAYDRDAAMFH